MRGLSLSALLSSALALPNHVVAQTEAPIVEPSTPWHLDGGEARCRLARKFGEGDRSYALFLETDEPSAYPSFLLAGPAMKDIDWRRPVQIVFGQNEPIELERAQEGELAEFGTALMSNGILLGGTFQGWHDEAEANVPDFQPSEGSKGLPRIFDERYADVDQIDVAQKGKRVVSLKIPGFQKALQALNVCSENFIGYWDLDLEKHRTRQKAPEWTNFDSVVRRIQADYPSAALRKGEQGVVRFMVIVDERGTVSQCRQSDATQLESLESPVCRAMQRAKFKPAFDVDGNPMRSYYASRVRYSLPN